MKKFLLSLISIFSLTLSLICTPTVKIYANESNFDCNYYAKVQEFTSNVPHYGCKEVKLYSYDEAVEAGIPEGFSGEVLEVVNNTTNRGIVLDFSVKKYPVKYVKSITFRVYVGDDGNPSDTYPEVRIPKPKFKDHWSLREHVNQKTNQWIEITIGDGLNSESFTGTMNDLSKDGYLNQFELAIRHNGPVGIFYIDSIKVNLIENDGIAPTLKYNGNDTVTVSEGQILNFDVTATDEIEGKVNVDFIWGDTSNLDENGNPLKGTHTLTFSATDYYGNTSQKTITVIVEEADVTAPIINVKTNQIHAVVGTTPIINVIAIDDKDGEVQVNYIWSENALTKDGKLNEGIHTLTISATDFSGNKVTETITFTVSEEDEEFDNVIDEEILTPKPIPPEENESVPDESTSIESQPNESESEKSESESIESESASINESTSNSEIQSDQQSENETESKIESIPTPSESKIENVSTPSESKTKPSKKGCKGALGTTASLITLTVIALVFIRKKENK